MVCQILVKTQPHFFDSLQRRGQQLKPSRSRAGRNSGFDQSFFQRARVNEQQLPDYGAGIPYLPRRVMKSGKQFLAVSAVALGCALPFSFAQNASHLHGGLVPGADIIISIDDIKKQNAAPFTKATDDMSRKMLGEEQTKEMQEKVEKALGLKEEEIEGIVFSVDIGNFNPMAGAAPSFADIEAAIAIRASKALSYDSIKNGIALLAEETGEDMDEIKFENIESDVGPLLKMVPKDPAAIKADGPQGVFAGLSSDKKTMVISFKDTTTVAGVKRVSTRKVAETSPEMQAAIKALGKDQHNRFVMVLPDHLQQMLNQMITGNMAGGAGGPAALMAPFADLKSVSVGSFADESGHITLQFGSTQPTGGTAMKGAIMQAIPMAGMMLGSEMPVINEILGKLKYEDNGPFAHVKMILSVDDVKKIMETAAPMMK